MKNKKSLVLDVGRELLKQKPNMTVCKIANAIGLKMFSQLLLSESLQGLFVAFPKKTTIRKILMRAKIRDELKNLSSNGKKFKIKVAKLAELFGINKCQIREEFNIACGRKRYEK